MARRSGLVEAEGSLNPGTRGMVASSPDEAVAGQHCQMTWRTASKTGRCNDSEPVYESPSRAVHQLKPDGYGLGSGAYPRGGAWRTPQSIDVVDLEVTVKACGVGVTKPQGHSWTPNLSNGSR